jgi:hypothetical protein
VSPHSTVLPYVLEDTTEATMREGEEVDVAGSYRRSPSVSAVAAARLYRWGLVALLPGGPAALPLLLLQHVHRQACRQAAKAPQGAMQGAKRSQLEATTRPRGARCARGPPD